MRAATAIAMLLGAGGCDDHDAAPADLATAVDDLAVTTPDVVVGAMFACPDVVQFLHPACDGTVDAGGCVVP